LKAENDAIDAMQSSPDTATATEAGFVWPKKGGVLQIVIIAGNPVAASPLIRNEPENRAVDGATALPIR
jgi:hypothetical protein